MVFKATFNSISVISWGSILLEEETWVPGHPYDVMYTSCYDFILSISSHIDWMFIRSAILNFDNESKFLIAMTSLFHSFTAAGINYESVIESLQTGIIKWSPLRKGYIIVLWIVGGTRWRTYSGVTPHFILKNNWSLRYLPNLSQHRNTLIL
jgi:hypothetical protein